MHGDIDLENITRFVLHKQHLAEGSKASGKDLWPDLEGTESLLAR